MDELIKKVKEYVISKSQLYKDTSEDNYDFWNEHVKYVYKEAVILAKKYNADISIVSLGALLHDIALIEKVGDRKDHHINGRDLSNIILDNFKCPIEVKERVLKCVFNHRSSKNATSIEELCVCDGDVLAHFDNIPMLFNSAFVRNKLNLDEAKKWIENVFKDDYNDLSDRTKELFEKEYENICNVVLKK